MVAPRRGPLLRLYWRLHKATYQLTGGRVGGRVVGLPVLELTVVGRRSGQPRSVLLNYLDDPDGYVVVASNAGHDRDPAWWLNLKSEPAAAVRAAGDTVDVRAEEVRENEYGTLWQWLVDANPGYAQYASRTDRHIPIVRLRVQK